MKEVGSIQNTHMEVETAHCPQGTFVFQPPVTVLIFSISGVQE